MPETSLINFRISSKLKAEMEQVCSDLGMNMTTAFTIFAAKMCREKRIPFEVSIDPFYSASNLKNIDKSVAALNKGRGIAKTIEELEAMEK